MKELTAKQQSNLVKTLEMLNKALLGIIQKTDIHSGNQKACSVHNSNKPVP